MLALALLALASCATLPSTRAPATSWGMLPPESDLFLFIDVHAARPLLETLAASLFPEAEAPEQWSAILERTAAVHAGLLWNAGAAPSVAAVATGRFSPALVGTRLGLSLGWRSLQNAGGARPYWRHRRQPLEVAAPECGQLLLSAGQDQGMERLLACWKRPGPNPLALLTPEIRELLQGAGAYLLIPEAVPFRDVWLAVRFEGGEASVSCSLTTEEEASPRSLQNLIRLLAASWMRRAHLEDVASRIKALSIEVYGRTVRVSGLRLEYLEILQAVEALR